MRCTSDCVHHHYAATCTLHVHVPILLDSIKYMYMYSNTQSKAAHLFQEKCSLLFCSSSTCVKGEEGESPQETASPRVRVIIISFKLSSPCGFHSDVVEDVTWHMVFMCVRFLPDLLVGHFILCARYSSG